MLVGGHAGFCIETAAQFVAHVPSGDIGYVRLGSPRDLGLPRHALRGNRFGYSFLSNLYEGELRPPGRNRITLVLVRPLFWTCHLILFLPSYVLLLFLLFLCSDAESGINEIADTLHGILVSYFFYAPLLLFSKDLPPSKYWPIR